MVGYWFGRILIMKLDKEDYIILIVENKIER